MNFTEPFFWLDLLAATMRMVTPLILAAMGGLLSERSGVVNLSLEGQMTVGAFAAAVIAHATGAPWLGFVAGGVFGLILAVGLGLSTLVLRANQIVAGTGLNMLAFGIPPFVANVLYNTTGSTPSLDLIHRLQGGPVAIACVLPFAIWAFMRWTRGGLWLLVSGEHPEALKSSGINLEKLRWSAVLTSGFLAGLGGATLSIFLSSAYTRNMTAGRGFIALAAVILGQWRPVPTFLACLLFGFAEALQIRLQGVPVWGESPVPVQMMQVLPYALTIIVLAGFVGRIRAPSALGKI